MKTIKLPPKDKFFVTSSGDLCRNDASCALVRPQYSFTFSRIKSARQAAATLRAGNTAWPGGYPLYFVTHDSAALCFECAHKEWRQIVWDFTRNASTGWRVAACDVNWEDPALYCDHCNKRIESAYAEDQAEK